jgi:hypothetical protein
MALTSENGSDMVMPVAPLYGGGNNGGFGGGFGGDWGWIILLLLLAGGNGWGNGFGGGIGGFAADGAALYPWMNQANLTSNGFQNQMLNDNVTSIRDGISNLATQLCNCCGDVQQSLCNGFAGVNATVNSGFANAETAANARQVANMQTAFAGQTAMNQGFNNVQSQLANCCCENRLASADLKYTIATENCADRAAISEGLRDIITNQTANTQRILDQLCAERIERKDDEIANLRQQIAMKDLAASQVAQNAFISQGFTNEVDALYNRLSNCPVPTTPVYGRTPIFTCNNNCGCGCGMN